MTLPSNFWPAIWSASAATFAYLLNRRNALVAIRPNVVLAGWSYDDEYSSLGNTYVMDTNHAKVIQMKDDEWSKLWAQMRTIKDKKDPLGFERSGGLVSVARVENIGIGTAFDITITSNLDSLRPIVMVYPDYAPFVGPRQSVPTDFRADIYWRDAPLLHPDGGMGKVARFEIKLIYHDVIGTRYEVTYHMRAYSPPRRIGLGPGAVAYAWGLIGFRTLDAVTSRSKLKMLDRIGRAKPRVRKGLKDLRESFERVRAMIARIYKEAKKRPWGEP